MRYSTRVVIFLLFLNAGAIAIGQAGVAGDMGIQPAVGGDDALSEANQSASRVDASGGFGGTLFGLYSSVASVFQTIGAAAFAGPQMLINLGLPAFFVTFLAAPLYLLVGIDVIYILTQRRP